MLIQGLKPKPTRLQEVPYVTGDIRTDKGLFLI